MLVPLLVLVGLLAAVLVRAMVVCRRPAWQRRQLERLSLTAQLPVDEGDGVPGSLRARLGERLAGREVGGDVGGLLGALVALVALLVVPQEVLPAEAAPYAALLLLGLGAAGGVAVVAARDALTAPSVPGPRRARSRAVGLQDHVPALMLLCARLLCAVPVVAVVVVLVRSALRGTPLLGRGGTPVAAVVLVVLVVCAWASAEAAARWFLALPQPAGRPVELAWDDVLRTSTIRRLAFLPTYLGSMALVLLPDLLTQGSGEPGSTSDLWSTVGLLVAGALWAGIFLPGLGRPPERYVRERLWPVVPLPGSPGEVDDPALAP